MNNNDYRQSHETVCAEVTVLDTSVEQTAERDLVLPDYYPDIFRILRCTAEPRIAAQNVSGGKLTLDTEVLIRVLYVSEGSRGISCIEQKVALSKSLDLEGDCASPLVRAAPCCGEISCRVVNKRRLDIRGIVTTRVKVTCEKLMRVLSGAEGCGVQLRKETMRYPVKRLFAAKRITVIEELELGEAKAPMGTPLRCGCVINKGEDRMIAGKLVTKGEAELTVVYSCVNAAGEDAVESMRFTLPFSQIIDVEGIDEDFTPLTDMTCAGCSVVPKGEDGRRLECELTLNVICTAVKYRTGELVSDGYFTAFAPKLRELEGGLAGEISERQLTAECSASVGAGEGVSAVTDCFAVCKTCSVLRDPEKGYTVTGTAELCLMGENAESEPFFARESVTFETETGVGPECPVPEVRAEAVSCTYILSDDRRAEVRARIRMELRSCPAPAGCLADLEPDREKPCPTDRTYALKLCRCEAGESLWDIAKRCSTSVEAIEEANADSEPGRLLLIPLV